MRLGFLNRFGSTVFEFLIVLTLVLFFLFTGVDYYVVLAQHQMAEHTMHYYLERVRLEGFLTTADEEEMKTKFNSIGLPIESISCPRQSWGNPRVLRKPRNLNASRITMTVTCKPEQRPLLIGRLIGGNTAPDSFRIRVGGSVLSERVKP